MDKKVAIEKILDTIKTCKTVYQCDVVINWIDGLDLSETMKLELESTCYKKRKDLQNKSDNPRNLN